MKQIILTKQFGLGLILLIAVALLLRSALGPPPTFGPDRFLLRPGEDEGEELGFEFEEERGSSVISVKDTVCSGNNYAGK